LEKMVFKIALRTSLVTIFLYEIFNF
jgi:hypothetical protein